MLPFLCKGTMIYSSSSFFHHFTLFPHHLYDGVQPFNHYIPSFQHFSIYSTHPWCLPILQLSYGLSNFCIPDIILFLWITYNIANPIVCPLGIPLQQSSKIISPGFQNAMFIINHLTISSTHFIRLFSASLRCLNSLPKPPLIFHKITFKRFSQLSPFFTLCLSYYSPCTFLSS